MDVLPEDISPREFYRFLVGGVSPRPIALVSTISEDGVDNLAPYSFFNVVSISPPMVAFTPTRRMRDGTTKDTYSNLMQNKECVVQAVTHTIVEQVNLASTEYASEENEFQRSGLTPIASDLVKPKRVAESPFQMECKLHEMVHLGDDKGGGCLAICQVVKLHICDSVLDNGAIQPDWIDLVGRGGGNFYTRSSGDALFEVPRPTGNNNIGWDNLPSYMRESHVYTANHLARFALSEKIPTKEEVLEWFNQLTKSSLSSQTASYERQENYQAMFQISAQNKNKQGIEKAAKLALEKGNTDFAWKAAVYASLRDPAVKDKE